MDPSKKHNECDHVNEFEIASDMRYMLDQDSVADEIDKFVLLQSIIDEQ